MPRQRPRPLRAAFRACAVYPGRLLRMPALRVIDRSAERSTLAIDGLVCGRCAARAQAALAAVPGVAAVRVDLARGEAMLRHAPGAPPSMDALALALARMVVASRLRRALARVARTGRRAGRGA